MGLELLHQLNITETDQSEDMGEVIELESRCIILETEQEDALRHQADSQGKEMELLKHTTELDEVSLSFKLEATELQKRNFAFLSAMEVELELATEAALEAREQLENLRDQSKELLELKNELLIKDLTINSLQLRLNQAEESFNASVKASSNAIDNMRWLEEEKGTLQMVNSEYGRCISSLESQVKHLETELHRSRCMIFAAESAEARMRSVQAGLHLAVKELAMEAQEAKIEARRLKSEAREEEKSAYDVDIENCSEDMQTDKCESMTRESWKAEVDGLKEELVVAYSEISKMSLQVEEAVGRAELAEKAKLAVEEQLRKWRQKQQQQRRAASEEQLQESNWKPREIVVCDEPSMRRDGMKAKLRRLLTDGQQNDKIHDRRNSNYVPLGKILNMKF